MNKSSVDKQAVGRVLFRQCQGLVPSVRLIQVVANLDPTSYWVVRKIVKILEKSLKQAHEPLYFSIQSYLNVFKTFVFEKKCGIFYFC